MCQGCDLVFSTVTSNWEMGFLQVFWSLATAPMHAAWFFGDADVVIV